MLRASAPHARLNAMKLAAVLLPALLIAASAAAQDRIPRSYDPYRPAPPAPPEPRDRQAPQRYEPEPQRSYEQTVEAQPEPERERPYQPQVLRSSLLLSLSRTLGGVHYLRVVCEGRDEQYWRERMIELMELESGGYRLREAMITAFNEGYYDEEQRHPQCGGDLQAAKNRLSAEGQRLAKQLGDPYL